MSENKFIKHLKGEDTAKSVLEIKNQRTTTSFANMPSGTSNANDVYSDHRGNAIGVLRGTDNWKVADINSLINATTVYGDGRDVTGSYNVSSNSLWVDAIYTFTGPKTFAPNTKFVLKLCGERLSNTEDIVPFSLVITIGNAIVTKSFAIREHAFEFSEEFVIDFTESNSALIKCVAGTTMRVQLLCGSADASATIYTGMTVFTALQRRVDGDAVASDKKTFDEVVDDVEQLQEDLDDLEEYVDETFVKKAGDTMSGALNIANIASSNTPLLTLTHSSTTTYKWNIAPRYNSTTLSIYPGSTETNGFRFATTGFVPASNNARYLGSASLKWKGVYTTMINNGGDLAVPANTTGTLATKADVDLAANSGRMITAQGVWYAKMYAATVPPAAEDGTNYADFSQVDGQGNPIIVIYNRVSGAWVQDQTITPPAEYDGYVPITSKIWDIVEQENQQGGRVMWNHQSKEFTPYPLIVDVSYLIDEIDTKQDKLTAGNNITITRLVPDGYDVLEYIESDGTQYINTLVPVNISNSFDIDCVLLSGNSDAHLISEGNVSIRVGANAFTWYTQAAHYLSTFTPGDNYNIQCGLNYLTVNGNTINGTTDSDNVSGASVYLFARNTAVSQCKARIKHVKIYDANSDLAFDGTPAIRNADGVVGLYDSVSETFFANSDAGASNFIAGDKIASTVISSTADSLPSQTGNSGKFLTTDGTDASWQPINASGYHPDLFDWKWADHQVNDVQWLRADTFSWQSGSVYEAAFNELFYDIQISTYWYGGGGPAYTKSRTPAVGDAVYLNSDLTTQIGTVEAYDDANDEITVSGNTYTFMSNTYVTPTTETVAGYSVSVYTGHSGRKIVSAGDETKVANIYAATGVAWYYIIDIPNKRFKLPRTKWGVTGYRDGVGNYVNQNVVLPKMEGVFSGGKTKQTYTGPFYLHSTEGSAYPSGTNSAGNVVGFDTSRLNSVYSGDGTDTLIQPRATQMYLYFYVGEFTQAAIENTAGLNAELFNDKVDVGHEVIAFQAPTAGNNYTWYRKYADGWVEQGGFANVNEVSTTTITLPVTMADTNYIALAQNNTLSTAADTENGVGIEKTSTTQVTLFTHYINPNTISASWEIKGMAA